MITGSQIVVHLVGDYILQSDWQALNKSKRSWPCLIHVILYTLPFLFLTQSWKALAFIAVTHFLIDRFGLARYVMWLKNHIGPFARLELDPTQMNYLMWNWRDPYFPWKECQQTGYHDQGNDLRPNWIRVWLLIIADNTLHLILNGIALRFL